MIERNHQSAVIRYWDSVASRYWELFRDELRDKPFDLKLLRKFADSMGAGARVCDVGCGPCAHVTRLLADAGLDTVGVDISSTCIALARREQPSLDLQMMDASVLEFQTSSFDGLVAYYLLHYFPRRSWLNVCAEFARVLRPNGRLLVVMKRGECDAWVPDPLGGPVETFWAAASQAEIESVISSAGFRLVETHSRIPLAGEITMDRIYLLAECAKHTRRLRPSRPRRRCYRFGPT